MATRRGRLRGTSVPAGEQPPSQLPSFLSDTHLLYTQTWQRGSPPFDSLMLNRTHGDEPVSLTGPKARIWLEKDESFRGVYFSVISSRLERGCPAKVVVSTKASLWVKPAIISMCFITSHGHMWARKYITLSFISKHIQELLRWQLKSI